MSTEDVTASAGPLHITSVLQVLADLKVEKGLPDPLSLRVAKTARPSCEVGLASFAQVQQWADAFGIDGGSRTSHAYPNGSSIHGAWLTDWCGWHVRFVAEVDAPAVTPTQAAIRKFAADQGWSVPSDRPAPAGVEAAYWAAQEVSR